MTAPPRGIVATDVRELVSPTRLLAGVLAVFTLFDFYFGAYKQGLRIFDLAGWTVLVGTIGVDVVRGSRPRYPLLQPRSDAIWWFIALFTLYAGIGALADPMVWKAVVAILMGLVVFLVYMSVEFDPMILRRALDALIVVHAVCLLTQFVVFKGTGHLINFQSITGGIPRVYSGIFRPSGLFLEPGTYSLTMVMLVLLRMRLGRALTITTSLGLATTLLTLSLFGVLAVGCVLVVQFWRRAVFWALLAAIIVVVLANLDTVVTALHGLQILERLSNVHGDSSLAARYGGLGDLQRALGQDFDVWFGRGISYDYIRYGSSSAAFVLQAGGVFGLGLLALIVALLSAPARRLESVAIVFLVLVAAPLWTDFFWWAWLGLLLRVSFTPSLEQWFPIHASASPA